MADSLKNVVAAKRSKGINKKIVRDGKNTFGEHSNENDLSTLLTKKKRINQSIERLFQTGKPKIKIKGFSELLAEIRSSNKPNSRINEPEHHKLSQQNQHEYDKSSRPPFSDRQEFRENGNASARKRDGASAPSILTSSCFQVLTPAQLSAMVDAPPKKDGALTATIKSTKENDIQSADAIQQSSTKPKFRFLDGIQFKRLRPIDYNAKLRIQGLPKIAPPALTTSIREKPQVIAANCETSLGQAGPEQSIMLPVLRPYSSSVNGERQYGNVNDSSRRTPKSIEQTERIGLKSRNSLSSASRSSGKIASGSNLIDQSDLPLLQSRSSLSSAPRGQTLMERAERLGLQSRSSLSSSSNSLDVRIANQEQREPSLLERAERLGLQSRSSVYSPPPTAEISMEEVFADTIETKLRDVEEAKMGIDRTLLRDGNVDAIDRTLLRDGNVDAAVELGLSGMTTGEVPLLEARLAKEIQQPWIEPLYVAENYSESESSTPASPFEDYCVTRALSFRLSPIALPSAVTADGPPAGDALGHYAGHASAGNLGGPPLISPTAADSKLPSRPLLAHEECISAPGGRRGDDSIDGTDLDNVTEVHRSGGFVSDGREADGTSEGRRSSARLSKLTASSATAPLSPQLPFTSPPLLSPSKASIAVSDSSSPAHQPKTQVNQANMALAHCQSLTVEVASISRGAFSPKIKHFDPMLSALSPKALKSIIAQTTSPSPKAKAFMPIFQDANPNDDLNPGTKHNTLSLKSRKLDSSNTSSPGKAGGAEGVIVVSPIASISNLVQIAPSSRFGGERLQIKVDGYEIDDEWEADPQAVPAVPSFRKDESEFESVCEVKGLAVLSRLKEEHMTGADFEQKSTPTISEFNDKPKTYAAKDENTLTSCNQQDDWSDGCLDSTLDDQPNGTLGSVSDESREPNGRGDHLIEINLAVGPDERKSSALRESDEMFLSTFSGELTRECSSSSSSSIDERQDRAGSQPPYTSIANLTGDDSHAPSLLQAAPGEDSPKSAAPPWREDILFTSPKLARGSISLESLAMAVAAALAVPAVPAPTAAPPPAPAPAALESASLHNNTFDLPKSAHWSISLESLAVAGLRAEEAQAATGATRKNLLESPKPACGSMTLESLVLAAAAAAPVVSAPAPKLAAPQNKVFDSLKSARGAISLESLAMAGLRAAAAPAASSASSARLTSPTAIKPPPLPPLIVGSPAVSPSALRSPLPPSMTQQPSASPFTAQPSAATLPLVQPSPAAPSLAESPSASPAGAAQSLLEAQEGCDILPQPKEDDEEEEEEEEEEEAQSHNGEEIIASQVWFEQFSQLVLCAENFLEIGRYESAAGKYSEASSLIGLHLSQIQPSISAAYNSSYFASLRISAQLRMIEVKIEEINCLLPVAHYSRVKVLLRDIELLLISASIEEQRMIKLTAFLARDGVQASAARLERLRKKTALSQAELLTRLGQFDAAEAVYLRILGDDNEVGEKNVSASIAAASKGATDELHTGGNADEFRTAMKVHLCLANIYMATSDVPNCEKHLASADELLELLSAETMDSTRGGGEEFNRNLDCCEAELLTARARVLEAKGLYKQAQKMHGKALAAKHAFYGGEHPKTFESVGEVAKLCFLQCKFDDTARLVSEGMQLLSRSSDKDHPSMASLLCLQARLEIIQGEYQQAFDNAKSAYSAAVRTFEEKPHPLIAECLWAIAEARSGLGDLVGAEQGHRQALAMRKEIFGFKGNGAHVPIAESLCALGRLLDAKGLYMQALPYHEQSVKIRLGLVQEMAAQSHPELEVATLELAKVYCELGRLDEAHGIVRIAGKVLCAHFGSTHLAVAQGLRVLGLVCTRKGMYKHSNVVLKQALEIYSEVLGTNHVAVAATMMELSENLRLPGYFTEAQQQLNLATDTMHRLFPAESIPVVLCSLQRARLLSDMGRHESALHLCTSASSAILDQLGASSGVYALSMGYMAECLRRSGLHVERTQRVLANALHLTEAAFGKDHAAVAEVQLTRVLLWLADETNPKDLKRAKELLEQDVLRIFESSLGRNHPIYNFSKACLSVCSSCIQHLTGRKSISGGCSGGATDTDGDGDCGDGGEGAAYQATGTKGSTCAGDSATVTAVDRPPSLVDFFRRQRARVDRGDLIAFFTKYEQSPFSQSQPWLQWITEQHRVRRPSL